MKLAVGSARLKGRPKQLGNRWFGRVALATTITGYLLIVVGAIVRVSGSGLGCGNSWPYCNGALIPAYSRQTAIEYTHRILAAVVVILMLALVLLGWSHFPRRHPLFILPIAGAGLVLVQSALGAITVALDLPAVVVTAHLGTAELFFGVLLVVTTLVYRPRVSPPPSSVVREERQRVRGIAAGTMLALFALILSGAYTATSGASLACSSWPGCGGRYLPHGWSPVDIQLLHRCLALIAALAVATLAFETARQYRSAPLTAWLAFAAAALMVGQITVGTAIIWSHLSPTVRGLHLAVATAIWGLLIVTVTVEHTARALAAADHSSFSAATGR